MSGKKIFLIMIVVAFIVWMLYIFKPIRTRCVMEIMAKEQLRNEPFYAFTDKYSLNYEDIQGPLVMDKGDMIEYTWFVILEWGDTAKVYSHVYKNIVTEYRCLKKNIPEVNLHKKDWLLSSWYLLKLVLPPHGKIGADDRWKYVLYGEEKTAHFSDILPSILNKEPIDKSMFYISPNTCNNESIEFVIEPDRLLYFLKKGYFFNDIQVEFYEPIAKITCNGIATLTRFAYVSVNSSCEITIKPYILQFKKSSSVGSDL